ncbi:hypothetical protein GLAREA_11093 [Glarea lozoyensis ATCC 20868]|uniref:Uncharacterized protein n=1 Tax=Glarea lozoyensis (strain ATCC 20868 / MF5171) TaxID=1116229 RepID=S3DE71_GLAL2|nr:uncharacterized protein GLAREA_11093 [Glarea lozoyensis ATCC 20868]EPE35394.1 hypothetical protein GLAREA_11093 [Glarea lozoyensis ATCC 20868]
MTTRFLHQACRHEMGLSEATALLLSVQERNNLMDTSDINLKLIIEPRWCPSCVSSRVDTIKQNHSATTATWQHTDKREAHKLNIKRARADGIAKGRMEAVGRPLTESEKPKFQISSEITDAEFCAQFAQLGLVDEDEKAERELTPAEFEQYLGAILMIAESNGEKEGRGIQARLERQALAEVDEKRRQWSELASGRDEKAGVFHKHSSNVIFAASCNVCDPVSEQ